MYTLGCCHQMVFEELAQTFKEQPLLSVRLYILHARGTSRRLQVLFDSK